MTDKRFVASKRDIILFSIISVFASIFLFIPSSNIDNDSLDYSIEIIVSLCLFLPEILAIIINKIILHYNVKNIKALKITKILFNIFTCLNFAFFGFLVCIVYAFKHILDEIK